RKKVYRTSVRNTQAVERSTRSTAKQLKKANPARVGDAKLGVSHPVRQPGRQCTPRKVRTMKPRTLRRSSIGLSIAVAMLLAGSAEAATVSTTCTAPALYQPFLSYLDGNGYSLAPGESIDNFSATGWTLSGGAKISTTKLADGTTGSVLTLPPG